MKLALLLLSRPGCLFVEKVDPQMGPAGVHGAMVINVAEQGAEVERIVEPGGIVSGGRVISHTDQCGDLRIHVSGKEIGVVGT